MTNTTRPTTNDEQDFSSLQDQNNNTNTNTIDPGWPLTAGVIVLCCVVYFVALPLSVVLHKQKCSKAPKRNNESTQPKPNTTEAILNEEQNSDQNAVRNKNSADFVTEIASSQSVDMDSRSSSASATGTSKSIEGLSTSSRSSDEGPLFDIEKNFELFVNGGGDCPKAVRNDDSLDDPHDDSLDGSHYDPPDDLRNDDSLDDPHNDSLDDSHDDPPDDYSFDTPPLSSYQPAQSDFSWRQVTSWDKELKQMALTSIPYSVQACKEGIFDIITIALLGHMVGTREANAYVVVNCILGMTSIFSIGFREAISTLSAQADGAGNDLLMGRYLQLGTILFVVANIPSVIIWCFWAYDAILWFGFDNETAELGQEYAYPALTIIIIMGVDDCLHQFLNTTGHEKYSMIFGILASTLHVIGILTMALLGCQNLIFIGIVRAILTFAVLVANFSIALYKGWLDDYWQGLAGTFSLKDRKAAYTTLATGIPLGITVILNYGEWEVFTVFAGFMGAAEVTTWGILGFVWNTMDSIVIGLSVVAQIRVGFHLGSGEPKLAGLLAYKSIFLGGVVSITLTSIFFMISRWLPRWLTPDPTLQDMISELLPLFGFFQIFMGVYHASTSILAAQGRARLVTTIVLITSWLVVIPVGAVTVFVLKLNLLGPVSAIVLGYSLPGALWPYLVMTSDWTAYSNDVRKQSIAEGAQYEDRSWIDLPTHIQEAALILGYNQELWDAGKAPAVSHEGWDDLNPSTQEALRTLGYNRKKWNRRENNRNGNGESHPNKSSSATDLPECHGFSHFNLETQNGSVGQNSEIWNSDSDPDTSKKEQNDNAVPVSYDKSGRGEQRIRSYEQHECSLSLTTALDYNEVSVSVL